MRSKIMTHYRLQELNLPCNTLVQSSRSIARSAPRNHYIEIYTNLCLTFYSAALKICRVTQVFVNY